MAGRATVAAHLDISITALRSAPRPHRLNSNKRM